MAYLLTGRIVAAIAAGREEPLGEVALRFYRLDAPEATKLSDAEAEGGGMATLLDAEAVRAKEPRWIGQARSLPDGSFRLDLSQATVLGTEPAQPYGGGDLEIDVFLRRLPGETDQTPPRESQIRLGVWRPEWTGAEPVWTAALDLRIPRDSWARLRTELDAWLISGHVRQRASGEPMAGARVAAFDADLLGDDPLGSALTDSGGCFTLHFPGSAFRDGSGALQMERTGPDVYFHVFGPTGNLLLAEPRGRAKEADRANAGNLLNTELLVDG